jgi:hypothetical protein
MGYVPYVGFTTHRRATVRIHLHFKRLMFKQMICIKKKWVVTKSINENVLLEMPVPAIIQDALPKVIKLSPV